MDISWKDVYIVLLYLGLGCACFFQVKESLFKYIAGKTTLATTNRHQVSSMFPTLSICSGEPYNYSALPLVNMSVFDFGTLEVWPTNPEEVPTAYDKLTFSMNDIIHSLELSITRNDQKELYNISIRDYVNGNVADPDKDLPFKITPFGTLVLGKCMSVKLTANLTTKDFIYITFNHNQEHLTGKPKIFVHPEGREVSVGALFWDDDPIEFNIEKYSKVNVMVKETEMRLQDEENCDSNVNESMFYSCIKDLIKKELFTDPDLGAKCVFGNCTVPQASFFYQPENVNEYCSNAEHATCASKLLYYAGKRLVNPVFPECPQPCIVTKYDTSQFSFKVSPSVMGNSSSFFIHLATTDVVVQEEYLLFDDNSIVASVGGSMGLFVSFSFLQCLFSIGTKTVDFIALKLGSKSSRKVGTAVAKKNMISREVWK